MVFFNSSCGSTIAEATDVQHISMFGISTALLKCSVNSPNGQLMLHTDSHATDSGRVQQEGRTTLGTKSKLLFSTIALSQKKFRIGHMYKCNSSLQWLILWSPRIMTFPPRKSIFWLILFMVYSINACSLLLRTWIIPWYWNRSRGSNYITGHFV